MVGLVISDNFLLTGNWQNANDGIPSIKDVTQVQFTEPIIKLLHDEAGLNTVLASALRQAKEVNSFAGKILWLDFQIPLLIIRSLKWRAIYLGTII
ncbi:hypothetical protein Ct9H90mP29_10110 [bacterium]|nr:MAG: hypothetical protein Ct9H90mP29_10110 [bacterium]